MLSVLKALNVLFILFVSGRCPFPPPLPPIFEFSFGQLGHWPITRIKCCYIQSKWFKQKFSEHFIITHMHSIGFWNILLNGSHNNNRFWLCVFFFCFFVRVGDWLLIVQCTHSTQNIELKTFEHFEY